MEKNLKTVLDYFSYFSYSPTFDEIHLFFPKKITRDRLFSLINRYCDQKKLLSVQRSERGASHKPIGDWNMRLNDMIYTLPQYSISQKNREQNIDRKKINQLTRTVQKYIAILRRCPFIQYVGVTGSSAMTGISQHKDVDLCIVSKSGAIWVARFTAIVIAKILKIHSNTGVCLNLFFDENDLHVPKKKHNIYVAHEMLQMKTIFDKRNIYEGFLSKNGWIFSYFPNAKLQKNNIKGNDRKQTNGLLQKAFLYIINNTLKWVQLPVIHRNKTSFIITNTQLWLFKNDFEKRLKREGLVI